MATVAFVSFRLQSRDSVASETEKWIRVLGDLGHETCRVAGYMPAAGAGDHVISELNYLDPEIEAFTGALFGPGGRQDELVEDFDRLAGIITNGLDDVFRRLQPDLIIAENIFSLPLNLPLSAALCRWLEGSGTACIAVHSDSCRNDPRFASPVLPEMVAAYIPAPLPQIMHVSMDAQGREELYSRSGLAATRMERCYDFETHAGAELEEKSPTPPAAGGDRRLVFFQPAGCVGCDCFERSISFVRRCRSVSGRQACLIIDDTCVAGCDSSGDGWLQAKGEGLLFAARESSSGTAGRSRLYQRCDAVIIPGACREFGNSLVESVVYRKPLLVADSDEVDALRSRGLQFLMLDERAADRIISLIGHPDLLMEMVGRNFELGRKYYSLDVLRERVADLMMSLVPGGNGDYS